MFEIGNGSAEMPSTWFAPADRLSAKEVSSQVARLASHPVVDSLLGALGEFVVILNAQRQIVALNTKLLNVLDCERKEDLVGLRLGEALQCRHRNEGPEGCGTSKACRSCGHANAIMRCQSTGVAAEEEFVVATDRDQNGWTRDFRIKVSPLRHVRGDFVVAALHDIRGEQNTERLRRVFFHDLMNVLTPLSLNAGELGLIEESDEFAESHRALMESVRRVKEMVNRERDLERMEQGRFNANRVATPVNTLLDTVVRAARSGPAAEGVSIECELVDVGLTVVTDPILTVRVLDNMVLNALEATRPGGTVRGWIETGDDEVVFAVWNDANISEQVALRIFERHRSTKEGSGRGVGTFSMKLLGEQYLGGQMEFTSGEEGTVFRLHLPA